jgi:hypothetical protein
MNKLLIAISTFKPGIQTAAPVSGREDLEV